MSRFGVARRDDVPFGHVFLEDIFPADFYAELVEHADAHRDLGEMDRIQDNAAFRNRRFRLVGHEHWTTRVVRNVFSARVVKEAILAHFYASVPPSLPDDLLIHDEFEYVYTKAGRFQNIHVDIPPKLVSFVFYLPKERVSEDEARRNATILYDRNLMPHYKARYVPNSVCIFAPHFYSYHGFDSTIDRDALVMFYIHWELRESYLHASHLDEPPFSFFLDSIEQKLQRHPLAEYGDTSMRLIRERWACRINAPHGRVLRERTA